MAMTEQHPTNTYFHQPTHARVDSKLLSDPSSEKLDEAHFTVLQQSPGSASNGGLRRCAATRDLTSIGANVNYSAKISVEYKVGDPAFLSLAHSWRTLSVPNSLNSQALVDNLETVCRLKKMLFLQLQPTAEGQEEMWPEMSLFRKISHGEKDTDQLSLGLGLEPIEGDQEALYMFGLNDGDRIVLLIHEASLSRTSCSPDPVAQWVESIRTQTDFESF